MNFCWIDWGIVVSVLAVITVAASLTKKHTRSVADFLAANRCAGRYLIGVSDGIAGLGAISVVAWFEAYYHSGFSLAWWSLITMLVTLVAALSGWVQYRFRQTRALTMAQFLEMRYSKRFRTFAGVVAFTSGILNFGIFPAVEARFFIYFCGLPQYQVVFFGTTINLTFVLVMTILLGIALYFALVGGQITVMVTDFIQGVFTIIVMSVVVMVVFLTFRWPQIVETLSALPAGKSMLNPLDTGGLGAFNHWYYLIYAFGMFWCFTAWLGNQGYSVCALNAHEARMGIMFSNWRGYINQYMVMILPICIFVMMHNSDWSVKAEAVNKILDGVSTNPEDTMRKQVTTTIGLTQLLRPGMLGAFGMLMLAASITTLDTYMHSWGSILIQDVILPLRKTRLSPGQHIKVLRYSIFGVATFALLFSIFFGQYDFILMFFALTGTIWLGGAGTIIIGGLYWRRGTTAGAYASLIAGIIVALGGFVLQKTWPVLHNGQAFPITSQWLWFIAMMLSIVAYFLLSMLGKKAVFNLDEMLHRGKFAVADDTVIVEDKTIPRWQRLLGVTSEFTFRDKLIYLPIIGWTIAWGLIFATGTLYCMIFDVPVKLWAKFWYFFVWMILVLSIVTAIWFTIGGIRDLKRMFHRLQTKVRDELDDGSVKDHRAAE
jgi:SSS family solute:Na+ symporter